MAQLQLSLQLKLGPWTIRILLLHGAQNVVKDGNRVQASSDAFSLIHHKDFSPVRQRTKQAADITTTGAQSMQMTLIFPQENEQSDRNVDAHLKSRTLALMMGWRSAKLAAITKHASVYSKAGIPIVCESPSFWETWSPQEGERLTRSVLSSITTSLDSPVSLVLHTFCSGSNLLLPLITSDFESQERNLIQNLEPACAVFDSAPGTLSFKSGFYAQKLIYNSGGHTPFSFLLPFSKKLTQPVSLVDREGTKYTPVPASNL